MGWKVAIDKVAAIKISDAIAWYKARNDLAASKLMSDLANRLNALEINPYFTKRYNEIY